MQWCPVFHHDAVLLVMLFSHTALHQPCAFIPGYVYALKRFLRPGLCWCSCGVSHLPVQTTNSFTSACIVQYTDRLMRTNYACFTFLMHVVSWARYPPVICMTDRHRGICQLGKPLSGIVRPPAVLSTLGRCFVICADETMLARYRVFLTAESCEWSIQVLPGSAQGEGTKKEKFGSAMRSPVSHPLCSTSSSRILPGPNTCISILHFNDVYNVEARDVEPVGGAPKFVAKVKQLAKVRCFSPCSLSPKRLGVWRRARTAVASMWPT